MGISTTRIAAALSAVLVLGATVFFLEGQRKYAKSVERFVVHFGSVELEDLTVADLPDEENAATWLVAGTGALDLDAEARTNLSRLLDRPPSEWDGDSRLAARRVLDSQAEAMALLRRAATCSQGNFGVDYVRGADTPLPPYLDLLTGLRLVDLEARLAAAEDDAETLAADLAVLATAIDTLAADSLLISSIVTFAVDRRFLNLLHDVVQVGSLNPESTAELGSWVSRRDVRRTLTSGVRGEGAFLAAAGPQDRFYAENEPSPLVRVAAAIQAPAYQWLRADILDSYSDYAERLDLSWPELEAKMANGALQPRFWTGRLELFVDFGYTIGRMKALESAYRLAGTAIASSRGPRTRDLGIDPFTGAPYLEERPSAGYLRLAAVGADDRWRELTGDQPSSGQPPPFDWTVRVAD